MTTTMTEPIPMTFDEFVGPYKIMGGTYTLHSNRAMRWLVAPGGSLRCLEGGYTIHRVMYSVHPENNKRQMDLYGPAVLTKIHDVTIGGAREHYVWVHPEHAQLESNVHIAAEMGIAWFLMTRADGTDWRLTAESRAKHGSDDLTKPGLEFRKMQYVLMVERGILDPGDSPMPEKGWRR